MAASNNEIADAIRKSKLPRKVKAVLIVLLSFRNHLTGKCNPGMQSISERLGGCKNTARSGIHAAQMAGVLSVSRSVGGYARSDLVTHSYTVNFDAIKAFDMGSKTDTHTGSETAPVQNLKGFNNCTGRGAEIEQTGVQKLSEGGAEIAPKPTYEPSFEEPSVVAGANHRPVQTAQSFAEEGFVIASIMRVTKQPISAAARGTLGEIQTTLEDLPLARIEGKEQPWAIVFDRAVQYAMAQGKSMGPVAIARYALGPAIEAQEKGRWPGVSIDIGPRVGMIETDRPVGTTLRRNVF